MILVGIHKLQDDARSRSCRSHKQQAENIEVEILKLRDIEDLKDVKRAATKVIWQERSMGTGLRVFAATRELDLGT